MGTAGSATLWHTPGMNTKNPVSNDESEDSKADSAVDSNPSADLERAKEVGGRGGLDPTRYGDWEKAGRCIDF